MQIVLPSCIGQLAAKSLLMDGKQMLKLPRPKQRAPRSELTDSELVRV